MESFDFADLYAKVSGYVQKLYVNWGTHVRAGQTLADLEIPELQQQLQQDEANVHRGESDLERAREEAALADRRGRELGAIVGRRERSAVRRHGE